MDNVSKINCRVDLRNTRDKLLRFEQERIRLIRFCESVLEVKEDMADKCFLREVPHLIIKELKRNYEEPSTLNADIVESRKKMEENKDFIEKMDVGEFNNFFQGV